MNVIPAILIGAALGASEGAFGALVGGLLGWLLVRHQQQAQQIGELQRAVEGLRAAPLAQRARADATEAAPAGPAARHETPQPPAWLDTFPATVQPDPGLAGLDTPERAPQAHVEAERPTRAAAPAALPGPLQRWLLGGNLIVKAGIAILFIGLAFLAKYASEQVDVPVELRLAGIGGVALALLVLGWRLRAGRPAYAQVLQGGAVAVLYLTLFAAFRFYGVLAAGPAFALMVVVAGLAAALAVLQAARPLAVIGALGGFATPLLLATGTGDPVTLFSYYLVLDLGIAAVAWHTTWRSLNVIGFLGTFVVASLWGVLSYDTAHYASSQGFLIAYFLLFNAILLMPARRLETLAGHDTQPWVNGSLLFGLPAITFALQVGMLRHTEYGVAISALLLAGFYVLLARGLRARASMALIFEASLAIGALFLTLVIPFALDASQTAGAWALEGAGLVWLGLRQGRRGARGFGLALIVLSGVALMAAHELSPTPTRRLNAFALNGLLLAAGALTAAFVIQRARLQPQPQPQPQQGSASALQSAEPLLIGWATLWLLFVIDQQIQHFVPAPHTVAAWIASLSAAAWIYIGLSRRLRWPRLTQPLIGHAPALALGVMASAATLANPLEGHGAWAWPLGLLTHAAVLRWATPDWRASVQHAIHGLGVLVLAGLSALLGRAITGDWGDGASAWPWLGWLVGPALLLLWLRRPASAHTWPASAMPKAYQASAAAVLTAALLAWTLLANVLSDGSAQPLPALPLLNPLDLGIATALFAAWLWLRSDAAQPLLARHPRLPVAVLAGAGFVWLNAMLIRAFHHHGGVPFQVDAWMASLAVQTGLTLLWSATALVLMGWSARRGLRTPWLVGAGLLGLVTLKLALIDLSGSGTVSRIVSFIGVGVLMLLIGYVAPLPSPSARTADEA